MAVNFSPKVDQPNPINRPPFSQNIHSNTLAKIPKFSKHSFSLISNFGIRGSSAKAPPPIHHGRVRLLALTKGVNYFVGAILSKIKEEEICIHNYYYILLCITKRKYYTRKKIGHHTSNTTFFQNPYYCKFLHISFFFQKNGKLW